MFVSIRFPKSNRIFLLTITLRIRSDIARISPLLSKFPIISLRIRWPRFSSFAGAHTRQPLYEKQNPKVDEGSKQNPTKQLIPTGYRVSRVEENYYLQSFHWLRTYLPSYWLSQSIPVFHVLPAEYSYLYVLYTCIYIYARHAYILSRIP